MELPDVGSMTESEWASAAVGLLAEASEALEALRSTVSFSAEVRELHWNIDRFLDPRPSSRTTLENPATPEELEAAFIGGAAQPKRPANWPPASCLLGTSVIYRSKTGDYSLAAVVTATSQSINLLGVERGQVPPITGPDRVHLAVLTPGLPPWETPRHTAQVIDPTRELGDRVLWASERPGENDLKGEEFVAQTAFGGTYQEFDIPMWVDPDRMQAGNRVVFGQDGYEYDQQAPGTWTWA